MPQKGMGVQVPPRTQTLHLCFIIFPLKNLPLQPGSSVLLGIDSPGRRRALPENVNYSAAVSVPCKHGESPHSGSYRLVKTENVSLWNSVVLSRPRVALRTDSR